MCCFAKHVLYLALVLNYVSHLALLIYCIVKKLLYLTLVFNLVCCALCPIVLVTFVACLFSTSALWHLCCLIRLLFGTSVICRLCYLAAVTTNPTGKCSIGKIFQADAKWFHSLLLPPSGFLNSKKLKFFSTIPGSSVNPTAKNIVSGPLVQPQRPAQNPDH